MLVGWFIVSAGGSLVGRHIWIIDDDEEFADLLAEVLAADADCTVRAHTQAPDPDELVAGRPDLVLLDLRLGSLDGADGWNLLQAIRAREELRTVPVILCSADVFALREHAEGIDDTSGVYVLEKPFGVDELLRALAWGCGDRAGSTELEDAVARSGLPAPR